VLLFLATVTCKVVTEDGDALVLDSNQAFGMWIGLSETDIPNRPH